MDTESPRQLPPAVPRLIRPAVLFELGLGVLALGIGWLLSVDVLADLRWSSDAVQDGVLATLPLLVLFALTWRWPVGPFRAIREKVERLLLPGFRDASLAALALVSLSAGLGEELLFRALLQGGLETPAGAAAALIVASVVFGLAHALTPGYALVATFMGAYLGGLWMATGNLIAPIVCHALYDFVALAVLVHVRPAAPSP